MAEPTVSTGIPPAPDGVVSKSSTHTVAETVSRLEAAIRAKGITLFTRIDHAENARRAGLAMQDAQVVIFGNPAAGTPLMTAAPLVALDLPLRVLVWRDATGMVWVSYQTMSHLALRYGIPDSLAKSVAALDAGLAALVDGATRA